ncbi:hypothetical protein CYMTET_24485 [Cymbomonas tetramitiformis]|uniref:Uncharacterized protein n=1 Tax=Cymbomonas tetramitiformis TaxID=36881 RepID=A0AAE0FWM2_9CHLO|nr:hypothetical protein CYMTET_24485 [Cymbomonas tetramitiformis]
MVTARHAGQKTGAEGTEAQGVTGVKIAMNNEKGAVQSLAQTIATKLKSHDLPPLETPAGHGTEELETSWQKMCDLEAVYEKALKQAIDDMKKQEKMLQQFTRKADKVAGWVSDMSEYSAGDEAAAGGKSSGDVQKLLRQHERYEDQRDMNQKALASLEEIVGGLFGAPQELCQARVKELQAGWQQANERLEAQKRKLEAADSEEAARDKKRLEFAQKAEKFFVWAGEQENELAQKLRTVTLPLVQERNQSLDRIIKEAQEKEADLAHLSTLYKETDSENTPNPYSRFAVSEILAMHEKLAAKAAALREDGAAQEAQEKHFHEQRAIYSDRSSKFNAWMSSMWGLLDSHPCVLHEFTQETEMQWADMRDLLQPGFKQIHTQDALRDLARKQSVSMDHQLLGYDDTSLGRAKRKMGLHAGDSDDLDRWLQEVMALKSKFTEEAGLLLGEVKAADATLQAEGLRENETDRSLHQLEEDKMALEHSVGRILQLLGSAKFQLVAADLSQLLMQLRQALAGVEGTMSLDIASMTTQLESVKQVKVRFDTQGEGMLSKVKAANEEQHKLGGGKSEDNEAEGAETMLTLDQLISEWDMLSMNAKNKHHRLETGIDAAREILKMQGEYVEKARKLGAWIQPYVKEYAAPYDFGSTVSDLLGKETTFGSFQQGVRPSMTNEKGSVESLISRLNNMMQTEGLGPYVEPEGLDIEALRALWRELETTADAYGSALTKLIAEQTKQEKLLSEFSGRAAKLEEWAEEAQTYATVETAADADAGQLLRQHEANYEEELAASGKRLETLQALAAEMEGMPKTQSEERLAALEAKVRTLGGGLKAKRDALQAACDKQQEQHKQRLQLAKRAEDFYAWSTGSDRSSRMSVSDDSSAIGAARQMCQAADDACAEKQAELDDLKKLAGETGSLTKGDTYSRFTVEDLAEMLAKVKAANEEEKKRIDEQEAVVNSIAQLKTEYVETSAAFEAWVKEAQSQLDAVPSEIVVDAAVVKERVAAVQELQKQLSGEGEAVLILGKAKAAHSSLADALAKRSQYADDSINKQVASYEALGEAAKAKKRTIQDHLITLKRLDEMEVNYVAKAQRVVQLIKEQLSSFNSADLQDASLAECHQKERDFKSYKQGVKPAIANEIATVETLAGALGERRSFYHLPEYEPPAGSSKSEISEMWKELGVLESMYETPLRGQIQAMVAQEKQFEQIKRKIASSNAWLDAEEAILKDSAQRDAAIPPSDFRGTKALLTSHQQKEHEYEEKKEKLAEVANLIEAYTTAGGHHASDALEGQEKLMAHYEQLGIARMEKARSIDGQMQVGQAIQGKMNEFAVEAEHLSITVDEMREELSKPLVANTLGDVQKQQTLLDKKPAQIQKIRADIAAAVQKLKAAGAPAHNPFSRFTEEDLEQMVGTLESTVASRQLLINKEEAHQRDNDRLKKLTADAIGEFDSWCEKMKSRVADSGGSKDNEADLAALEALAQEIDTNQAKLQAAEAAFDNQVAAGITMNEMSEKGINEIRADWDMLQALVQEKRNLIQAKIDGQSAGSFTAAQMRDYKNLFENFDKDQTKTLKEHELQAVLTSLDMVVAEDKIKELFKDGNPMDFDAFVAFMADQLRDTDTYDQMLESFKVLAGGKDFISAEDLGKPQFAEVLPPDIVDYVVSRIPKNEDGEGLNYEAFASRVFGKDGMSNEKSAEEIAQADAAIAEKAAAAVEAARLKKEEERRKREAEELKKKEEEEELERKEEEMRRQREEEQRLAIEEQHRLQKEKEEAEAEQARQMQVELERKKSVEKAEKAAKEAKIQMLMEKAKTHSRRRAQSVLSKKHAQEEQDKQAAIAAQAKKRADEEKAQQEALLTKGMDAVLHKKHNVEGSTMGMFKKKWSDRWASLGSDGVLRLYKDKADAAKLKPPSDEIILRSVPAIRDEESYDATSKEPKMFCFALERTEGALILCAESKEEKDAWMQLIGLWISLSAK